MKETTEIGYSPIKPESSHCVIIGKGLSIQGDYGIKIGDRDNNILIQNGRIYINGKQVKSRHKIEAGLRKALESIYVTIHEPWREIYQKHLGREAHRETESSNMG